MKRFLKSFRVRLIVLMVLLSGFALAAFGFVTWRVVLKEKYEQLDLTMETAALKYAELIYREAYKPDSHMLRSEPMEVMRELWNAEFEFLLLRQDGKVLKVSAGLINNFSA